MNDDPSLAELPGTVPVNDLNHTPCILLPWNHSFPSPKPEHSFLYLYYIPNMRSQFKWLNVLFLGKIKEASLIGGLGMKVLITASEAIEKGIWLEVLSMFGRDPDEELGLGEQFILTEEQALSLGLIRK